jgi:hypothetical protein
MRDGLADHVRGTLNGLPSYGCWMGKSIGPKGPASGYRGLVLSGLRYFTSTVQSQLFRDSLHGRDAERDVLLQINA